MSMKKQGNKTMKCDAVFSCSRAKQQKDHLSSRFLISFSSISFSKLPSFFQLLKKGWEKLTKKGLQKMIIELTTIDRSSE